MRERTELKKLTVEVAQRQVSGIWRRMREGHGFAGNELTAERVKKIFGSLESYKPSEQLAYYEIGHKFAVEHVVEKVRGEVGLKKSEELLLRRALGRLVYNVPARESIRQSQAASNLSECGGRGQQIFDATLEAYRKLAEDESIQRELINSLTPFNALAFNKNFEGLAAFYKIVSESKGSKHYA